MDVVGPADFLLSWVGKVESSERGRRQWARDRKVFFLVELLSSETGEMVAVD